MPDNDDAIDRLSKKLYSQNNDTHLKRTQFFRSGNVTPNAWKPDVPEAPMKRRHHIKPLELLLIGSMGFFLVAVVVSTFLFFGGNNTVSTRNVDIQITGPTQVGAGSTLSLQIVVTNRNAVPMELTDLIIEFPSGTRSDKDVSVELPRIRESLGTIEPGESVSRSVRAVLFGVQGTEAVIKASTEYRVPSSNAVFVSDALYTARISESPASIVIDSLNEAVSGQVVTISIDVTSNSPNVLSDMLLVAAYPPGFLFNSSSPAPVVGGGAWELGDIEPGGTRTVTINGTFSAEDGESRVVHFTAGNKKTGEDRVVAAPLATSDMILTVRKPFVSVELALEGDTAATHAIQRGREVEGTIRWTNNLPTRIQNVSIVLELDGQILDRSKVKVSTGFFNSATNSIIWDKSTEPDFADLPPGASGEEQFAFTTLPPNQGSFKNAEINLSATVSGNRLTESNVPEIVESTASVQAVVLTDLILHADLGRSSGDSGPLPPKVDTETTYTVTWNVTNSGNAVANARVTGVLPLYVSYIGAQTPSNEDVSYNATGRLITWTIGDLAIGQSKTVTFRVSLTPSISQVGSGPIVISDQEVSGLDRYVRYALQRSAPPLATTDGAPSHQAGIVVP